MMALLLACLLAMPLAQAQVPPVERLGFSPPAGAHLPLDAAFVDETGGRVTLGDYLDRLPAIVVPAYFGCSNLCSVVARGVAASLAAGGLVAGRDVEVVVVSIDPRETSADALARKRDTIGANTRGWHFLVGDEASVARVVRALGYRYAWDDDERQYAHAAGIALAAPGGALIGVLYGVAYPPAALRSALRGAAVRAPATEWLLCFHYDPATGRYTLAALTAARLAALAALAGLTAFIWRARRT